MEKTITISFDEYQELKKENEMLKNTIENEHFTYAIETDYYLFGSTRDLKIWTNEKALELLSSYNNRLKGQNKYLREWIKSLRFRHMFNLKQKINYLFDDLKNIDE
jgi:hypothetical protein